MDVTVLTWVVAIAGLVLIGLLASLQLVAIVRPRAPRTVEMVYGGNPDSTDPKAYFAFNQGLAWADVVLWAPLQIIGSIGMLLGREWGFVLALAASVPYLYSAIPIFVWDRDMGFRKEGFVYWVVICGMWPAFGVIQGIYAFVRLVE